MEKIKMNRRALKNGALLAFMLFIIGISNGIALEQGTQYIAGESSTSISSDEPISRIALLGDGHSYYNLLWDTESEVGVDFDGIGDDSITYTTDLENHTSPEIFPQDNSVYPFTNSPFYDPWNYAAWVKLYNNTEFNGDIFNISVTATQNDLGSLGVNDKKTILNNTQNDCYNILSNLKNK